MILYELSSTPSCGLSRLAIHPWASPLGCGPPHNHTHVCTSPLGCGPHIPALKVVALHDWPYNASILSCCTPRPAVHTSPPGCGPQNQPHMLVEKHNNNANTGVLGGPLKTLEPNKLVTKNNSCLGSSHTPLTKFPGRALSGYNIGQNGADAHLGTTNTPLAFVTRACFNNLGIR